MVAGTVIRDDETGFAPILRSTRIGKGAPTGYLLGRRTRRRAAGAGRGAAGDRDRRRCPSRPDKVGPWHLSHYLWALFVSGCRRC